MAICTMALLSGSPPAEVLAVAIGCGAETAVEGTDRIARVRERAALRLEVLPCGKVRAANIGTVLRRTGCDQVHGAFTEPPRPGVAREAVAARAELDRLAASLSSPP